MYVGGAIREGAGRGRGAHDGTFSGFSVRLTRVFDALLCPAPLLPTFANENKVK